MSHETRLAIIPVVPESQFAEPAKQRKRRPKLEWDPVAKKWVGKATIVTMRKHRAAGVDATKRVFASKSKPRAASDVPMVRGDKMFWHDEYHLGEHGVEVIQTPNSEKDRWLRAGADESPARFNEHTKEGRRARARERSQRTIPVRVAEMVELLSRKTGRLPRPSTVAWQLVREDLKWGRYPQRGVKHKAAHQRYMKAARVHLAQASRRTVVETLTARAQKAAAKQARKRVVSMFAKCEHSWRVTPKRTKRTCKCCGAVDRKVRGRWQQIQAGAIQRVS